MIRAEKRLNLPLPEMTFGNNSLLLKYQGDEEITMRFNGLEALAEVGVGEGWEERIGGGVLVSMAETWGKNRYVLLYRLLPVLRATWRTIVIQEERELRALTTDRNLVNCYLKLHSLLVR